MGVSGVGKTTIGKALADELGWAFLDADDFHPPRNVARMAAGQPLDDADRAPWLERLNQELARAQCEKQDLVLACSALKERYRVRLAHGVENLRWIYLKGDPALLQARLAQRQHAYMPPSLLGSQLAALEPPEDAITVDVAADVGACVAAIASQLRS